MKDVPQRVLAVIGDVLNCNDLSVDFSLRDSPDVDSLKQMAIFIALEDEFQRTIPPEDVAGLDTVADIVTFIHKKLQEPS